MATPSDRYTHGHHESVLRSHQWRTAKNSAAYLLDRLEPGQSLLDVGCGPGTITADLARLVAPGPVIGIDLAESVIDVARGETVESGLSNLSFATDDVYQLSFDEGSFDVVHAHQVLQHLSDPVAALVQMRRVLREGGLLAVRDADYGGFIWHPASSVLDQWMKIYHELTTINRAQADGGRHLVSWVRAAGFDDLEVTSTNWIYQRHDERRWWGQLWADRVQHSSFAQQCLENELATQEQLEQIGRAFIEWIDEEDGLFIVPSVEVLAHK
jgi:ubiquinone/menaquinone biosynthesis C-methylase UbiE